MSTHSQVVITAPHSYVLALQGVAVILGMRESLSQTIHPLENTVSVVHPLLLNLAQKEPIIVKVRLERLKAGGRT